MQDGAGDGDGRGQHVCPGIRIFAQCQNGGEIVRAAFFVFKAFCIPCRIGTVLAGMDEVAVTCDESRDHEHLPVLGIPVDIDAAYGKQIPHRQQNRRHEAE